MNHSTTRTPKTAMSPRNIVHLKSLANDHFREPPPAARPQTAGEVASDAARARTEELKRLRMARDAPRP